MPPKKKTLPEPKVDIPNGDGGAGRELFDQHCSACHAMEGVLIISLYIAPKPE